LACRLWLGLLSLSQRQHLPPPGFPQFRLAP
jgi:hypothetical protein